MSVPPSAMPYSPRPRRRFFARPLVRLILFVLVILGIVLAIKGTGTGKPSGPPPVNIKVATASQQSVPVTINAVGNVVAYESVAIRARLDSQVVAVHFKDGDEVKKGDLLFELDDKSLRAQAAELEANIARDRAQLENARRQSSRATTLADKGFATKATKDDSNANVAVAAAALNASIAAYDSVKIQLGYTRITAPITGRTGTINVTLGNNVKANDTQPLVTINQLKPIRVQAALPQQYFDSLRAAMQSGPVTVGAALKDDVANNTIAQGTLDYIDNAIDAATGTFVTRAGFTNNDERLLPGMFVTVTLTLGAATNALAVPEIAIQRGQAGDYVFVIINDKAMKRDVKVARLSNNFAVIESGLEAGTVVAVDGLLGLKDGAPVKITEDKPAAPEAAPEAK
ncbi:MAG: efflux RND transporter periplasmic adaptor subunit [Rickettsiales bacterium]